MAGAVFGDGVYFATEARIALKYAGQVENGYCYMYCCSFLTGSIGLKEAPPRSDVNDVYDSVVDNVHKPSMFIIFRDNQAYPDYLITFR